ncbi:MAG: thermonuclease family protein [Candidatus Aminicenantales bacterium]
MKKVIDGDTIQLDNGQWVRYIGIDAPEVGQYSGKKRVRKSDFLAEEAREFNRTLVAGKKVRLELDVEERDQYNRLLAYCFVDNLFVNALLLKKGYAYLMTIPPNVKYVDVFIESQRYARQNKIGLWKDIPTIHLKDVKKHLNKIVRIEEVVSSVVQTPQLSMFFFKGFNFRVIIFKESYHFFQRQGISLATFYKGKKIRVIGTIKRYKKNYEIIAGHPSDIEVLKNGKVK